MKYYNEYDFYTAVAKGHVRGHRIMSAMGEFESGNVAVAGEDVCRHEDVGGPVELPQPAPAGEQLVVISTSAEDGVAGDGVITLRLEYLDTSGVEQTEDIIMKGQTAVDTIATNILFVNDMHALTVGATGVAEGHITCYKKTGAIATHLYQFIVAGGNKSLVPHRMVPLGHSLFLKGWHAEEAGIKRCLFRLRSTDMNGELLPGVFCFKDTAFLNQSTTGERPLMQKIPALSVVKVSYWAIAINAEGSCGWWGLLVKDGF